jgi:hypothetical protein
MPKSYTINAYSQKIWNLYVHDAILWFQHHLSIQFTSGNFLIGYALSALNVFNAASTPAIRPCQITSYINRRENKLSRYLNYFLDRFFLQTGLEEVPSIRSIKMTSLEHVKSTCFFNCMDKVGMNFIKKKKHMHLTCN